MILLNDICESRDLLAEAHRLTIKPHSEHGNRDGYNQKKSVLSKELHSTFKKSPE